MNANQGTCHPGEGTKDLNRLPCLADALLRFDLQQEMQELRREDSWGRETGRGLRTLERNPGLSAEARCALRRSIDKNPEALAFLMSVNVGKQRTPTFEVGGNTFRGSPFDPLKLVRELGLQRTLLSPEGLRDG